MESNKPFSAAVQQIIRQMLMPWLSGFENGNCTSGLPGDGICKDKVTKPKFTEESTKQPYVHLTNLERFILQEGVVAGKSVRAIARKLGRSPSTITRELKRSANKIKGYNYWGGYSRYRQRRKSCVRKRIVATDTKLHELMQAGLFRGFSPEAIVERYKKENPGAKLAKATIYRAVHDGLVSGCTTKEHLRRRGKRKTKSTTNTATIKAQYTIHDWPEPIKNRSQAGHLEGDTIVSAIIKGIGTGAIVTLVCRKNRVLYAALVQTKDMHQTKDAIIALLKGHNVKSITFDRGSEFGAFKEIAKELNIPIYFADPHSPWQRGTNENTNGILRFYFPKGYDFRTITKEKLEHVVNLINNRPRKCLDWLSPHEAEQGCYWQQGVAGKPINPREMKQSVALDSNLQGQAQA